MTEVATEIRTKFIDFDARPNPKTSRWCVMCQRDLKPGQPHRVVSFDHNTMLAVHPEDVSLATVEISSGLLGADCAKKLGLEWSVAA